VLVSVIVKEVMVEKSEEASHEMQEQVVMTGQGAREM